MANDPMILDILRETGVMQEGHFVLTSGRHSDRYMQCAHIFEYPQSAAKLTEKLAEQFRDAGVTLVVGPAVGGISIAYELARQLGVRTVFAERENGVMTLRRGFTIHPEDRVVVAEDVITTGGSVREVIELVRAAGAELAGVAVAVDRSAGQVDFGAPLCSAVSMQVVSWEAQECPLCKQGIPVAKPGSRTLKK